MNVKGLKLAQSPSSERWAGFELRQAPQSSWSERMKGFKADKVNAINKRKKQSKL